MGVQSIVSRISRDSHHDTQEIVLGLRKLAPNWTFDIDRLSSDAEDKSKIGIKVSFFADDEKEYLGEFRGKNYDDVGEQAIKQLKEILAKRN